jgi:hypothetical protein
MSGFGNRPRVLKGAFVEYGLSLPPLAVVFQFNPVQLQRSRTLSFRAPNEVLVCAPNSAEDEEPDQGGQYRWERPQELRDWHAEMDDLTDIREQQIVTVQEEQLQFTLQLDASDALNDGDAIAETFGIAPALSTLELMTQPKGEGVIFEALGSLLGAKKGYQFASRENPPMVLFIWGLKRVLPVNITSLVITETEFDSMLNPIRATVDVSLSVVEGKNPIAKVSTAIKEVMSVLNVAQAISEITIPG